MRRVSRSKIEAAARSIRLLVPVDSTCEMRDGALALWTARGRKEMKWPGSFTTNERKLIRAIARTVLSS